MVHYLFLPWNLPWIILAYYGNQQQQQKKTISNTQIRRRCMRHLIRMYTVLEFIYRIWDRQTVLIQKKKEEEENGCVQAVHSFITLSKATFDLLDTPTAPGCFAVSVYSHVSHKWIIRLPLLMIRVNRLFTAQRSVKCWFFDNVWIMT